MKMGSLVPNERTVGLLYELRKMPWNDAVGSREDALDAGRALLDRSKSHVTTTNDHLFHVLDGISSDDDFAFVRSIKLECVASRGVPGSRKMADALFDFALAINEIQAAPGELIKNAPGNEDVLGMWIFGIFPFPRTQDETRIREEIDVVGMIEVQMREEDRLNISRLKAAVIQLLDQAEPRNISASIEQRRPGGRADQRDIRHAQKVIFQAKTVAVNDDLIAEAQDACLSLRSSLAALMPVQPPCARL